MLKMDLPVEIWLYIFDMCSAETRLKMSYVDKFFYEIIEPMKILSVKVEMVEEHLRRFTVKSSYNFIIHQYTKNSRYFKYSTTGFKQNMGYGGGRIIVSVDKIFDTNGDDTPLLKIYKNDLFMIFICEHAHYIHSRNNGLIKKILFFVG